MAQRKRKGVKIDTDLKQEALVIFTSATGRPPWHPLKEEEVPAWVKAPDVMGKMVAGEDCMDVAQGDKGSNWYRAVRVSDLEAAKKLDH